MRAAPLADAGVTPYRAVRRAQPWLAEGGAAVVLGAGALGQFAIQYLKRLPGVRVVAVDPAPVKQQIARDLGADAVPLEGADAALDRVRRGEVAGRLVLTP